MQKQQSWFFAACVFRMESFFASIIFEDSSREAIKEADDDSKGTGPEFQLKIPKVKRKTFLHGNWSTVRAMQISHSIQNQV